MITISSRKVQLCCRGWLGENNVVKGSSLLRGGQAMDLKDTISQGFDRVGLSEVRGLR